MTKNPFLVSQNGPNRSALWVGGNNHVVRPSGPFLPWDTLRPYHERTSSTPFRIMRSEVILLSSAILLLALALAVWMLVHP